MKGWWQNKRMFERLPKKLGIWSKGIVEFGDWDIENSSELDNIAYYIYCKKKKKEHENSDGYAYYTQKGFIDSVGSEEIYGEAKIHLRRSKIDKLFKKRKLWQIGNW